jgi:hypothetical protein
VSLVVFQAHFSKLLQIFGVQKVPLQQDVNVQVSDTSYCKELDY